MMKRTSMAFVLGVLLTCVSVQANEAFHNDSEVGLVVTSGNTKTQTLNAKSASSYEFSGNLLKLPAYYLRSKSNGVQSAKQWGLGLRYERAITERYWVFVAESLDANIFAGYKQRYSTDLGPKVKIIQEDDFKWNGELGYRYLSEHRIGSGGTVNSHYLRLFSEAEKKWTESFSNQVWVEYLPNFTTSEDYQVNGELAVLSMLNKVFSLKFAYLVKFDNLPAPGVLERVDTVVTTAIVAKF